MRIKGIVSYDGSHYQGFQDQKKDGVKTIQKEIERLLSYICNSPITIFASGRTDRGVHALNQVFHFDLNVDRDINHLKYALNRMLPRDILIKSLEVVSDDFHARYSAKRKHYRYIVDRVRNPFNVNYALFYDRKIDEELLNKGMKLFLGEHDFINFCSNKEEESYIRTIYQFTYHQENNQLIFDIIGSGFKRYMVRMIIGTVLALNNHQIELNYIEQRLVDNLCGTTIYNAEPQGLYLMEVYYD